MTGAGGSSRDRAAGQSARNWSSSEEFRRLLAEGLGQEWEVEIIAQMPEPGEVGTVMSVAAEASRSDGVKVHVTHDRGADVVLLSVGDGPQVPFEDVAVAKGKIDLDELVRLSDQALDDPPGRTAFTLDEALRLIGTWSSSLAGVLGPENPELRDIAGQYQAIMDLKYRSRDR